MLEEREVSDQMETHITTHRETGVRTLVQFVCLTFGLTWGLGALYVLFPSPIQAIFGEFGYTNPLFILAVYAPGFAGIFLVLRRYGLRGMGRFLRRLTLVRMPLAWWLFLVLGMPALFYLAAGVKGSLSEPFPFSPWYTVFPALATALFIGPIEEFGWRGVALPLLQRKYAPFWSGLIIGVIWAVWHLPSFFFSGSPQSNWSFVAFFIALVAMSLIMTAMFNSARGSILIPALFHFQMNGPVWPDAQPWDTVVFALTAVAVVLLNSKAMFSRTDAVTEVLASPAS
jgi:membrane protease YdiL (CAAX protease family)